MADSLPTDIKAIADYDKMQCQLLFDGKLVKSFNLNKAEPGRTWGYFMFHHPDLEKQEKYHVIIELGSLQGNSLANPKLHIYPKIGTGMIIRDSVPVEVKGEWETYLKNHKNYGD